MRGDGPRSTYDTLMAEMFPPHARGWTQVKAAVTLYGVVSPACAGMDPPPGRLLAAR